MGSIANTNKGHRWTVKTWDRERGRGVITSPQIGDLYFDASAAMASDFRLGEVVQVDLEARDNTFNVRRIWPDEPRFAPRDQSRHPDPLPLRADLAARALHILADVPETLDFRLVSFDGNLVVQGDYDNFAYGHRVELTFVGVDYIELPVYWGGRSFALANDDERAYLAARSELNEQTIAVRIVGEDHVFFVTCTDLECKKKAG